MSRAITAGPAGRVAPARDSLAIAPPTREGRGRAPGAFGAPTGRGLRWVLSLLGLSMLCLLFLSPGSYGAQLAGAPSATGAPHAVALPAAHSPSSAAIPPTSSVTGLAGSDPRLDTPLDVPSLVASQVAAGTFKAAQPVAALKGGAATTASTSAAPVLAPVNTGCPVATFTGTVKNYSGFALSGVVVQAYSVSTCVCPQSVCPTVSTNASGGFAVKGPVGADYLTYIISGYLENISYVTGYAGITTALNYTVYLVAESRVSGTVEANTSKHSGIAGVQVKCLSRDLQLLGNPTATTGSNGYFTVACPPVPSQISFSPPYGYLPTYLDLNSTPGQVIDVGVIYLDKEAVVSATLYDAVTGNPLPTGGCSAFDTSHCHALTVCSSLTNSCLNQGVSVGTDTVTALGPLGYDYLKVEAVGYLENEVPIGLVNTSTDNAGKVYMVPLGSFAQSTSVTANTTTLPFTTGLWYDTVCSMNGLYAGTVVVNPATFTVNMSSARCVSAGCAPARGATVTLPAFPLRNDIVLQPDTTATCGITPTWPIPGMLPVWGNETYVNATPDMTTPGVYLNLTPGDYVYGNVTDSATHLAPTGGFSVLGLSQDNPTLTSYAYSSTTSPWMCAPYPRSTTGFCVPAPPGPGELRVTSLTQSYAENFTWGSASYLCCYKAVDPITLNRYTQGAPLVGEGLPTAGVTTINLTAQGGVYGRVFRGNTDLGVFFGSIQVTPAGTNPLQPSFDGPIYINGSFWTQSSAGWVSVTASASGFSPDTVWAYVTGNISVGNISLTPLATVQGQVRDPTGHGIYDAQVTYCPIASTSSCTTALGAGLSTSDGTFNGTLTGGWLPWTTYVIHASSSGYTSDWAWVNATAGQTTTVPTLTLYPVGTNTSAAPRPSSGGSASAGVWVDGYLRDQLLDWGVVTNSIQACPLSGLSCDTFNLTNQDGYFNDSVLPGNYNLVITPTGYQPVTVYFNATLAAVVHLGNIFMTELPWVTGFANITPFGEISVKHGTGWVQILLAPGANALACNGNGTVCGLALPVSSQGLFYVMTGGGIYNKVQVIPSGGTVATSPNGGFSSNTTIFNTTGSLTNLSAPIELTAYVQVAGYVYDNSSTGPGGVLPWIPVRWAPVSISTYGPNHASVAWTTNGGGWYLFFVPPGPKQTIVAAGGTPEADIARNVSMTTPLLGTTTPTIYPVPSLNLTHFGWVVARVSASPNGTAAALVPVSATFQDPINGTLSTNGLTNGGGYVNLTAPPGPHVVVSIGPGADYNGTNFTVRINATQTTYYNGTQFWGLGNETIPPWGWIRSLSLNNTTQPVVPTVVDSVNGLPLPFATVTASSNAPGLSGSSAITNWNGEFIVDAPISKLDALVVTKPAYLQNTTIHVIKAGEILPLREINLTGVGVLAGTVIGYPGNQRIPFAVVQDCPYNSTGFSSCYTATANASGIFWVPAVPGLVSITASANGYVTNKAVVARSCSDCWNWLQPIVLDQFSYVIGTVRGLPSGLPLFNASVSACSTLGHPVGACGFTVVTPSTGSFTLAVPAGQYILQANHTGFNSSYLPIGLVPGEVLPVGVIFLKQFGTVYGQIVSSATLLPVYNASVIACPLWSGGACAPAVASDVVGHFIVAAAPGPYTLAVLAGGFEDGYARALFTAGVTSALPPILISPLGIDTSYAVSGRVVNGSAPSQGIDGATIAAIAGSSVVFSTKAHSDGSFSFTVLYGVYTLQVTANGYRPVDQALTVHGVVSGLLFPMAVMTYNVSGTVTDGFTHDPLPGVAISEGGIVESVSDVNGAYSIALANGTHALVASYEGGSSATYGDLPFAITVNGAPQVHDLQLIPPTIAIQGTVIDALSGTPLPSAAVTVLGVTDDGLPVRQTLLADGVGNFTVTLPFGSYNVTAAFSGYTAHTVSFQVTTAGALLAVPLSPQSIVSPQPPAPSGATTLYVLVGAVAVIVGALAILGWLLTTSTRRRGAPARKASAPRPARPPAGGR